MENKMKEKNLGEIIRLVCAIDKRDRALFSEAPENLSFFSSLRVSHLFLAGTRISCGRKRVFQSRVRASKHLALLE